MPGWLTIIICILETIYVVILCGSVFYLKPRKVQSMEGHFLDIFGHKTNDLKLSTNIQKAIKKTKFFSLQRVSNTAMYIRKETSLLLPALGKDNTTGSFYPCR